MKIVADENIESEIVDGLRTAGHEIIDIKATHPGIDDRAVLDLAADEGAILLTRDKDFGELVYREGRLNSGVILLRIDRSHRVESLLSLLADHEAELVGAFSVITRFESGSESNTGF